VGLALKEDTIDAFVKIADVTMEGIADVEISDEKPEGETVKVSALAVTVGVVEDPVVGTSKGSDVIAAVIGRPGAVTCDSEVNPKLSLDGESVAVCVLAVLGLITLVGGMSGTEIVFPRISTTDSRLEIGCGSSKNAFVPSGYVLYSAAPS